MQYYLRFWLAMMVVTSHFWPNLFPGAEGAYAVMGFYVISGYVITLVLDRVYFKLGSGLRKFWINRFFRLYPTYAVSAVAGIVCAFLIPEAAFEMNKFMVRPETALGAERLTDFGISQSWWPWFYVQTVILVGQQSPFAWTSPIGFSPNGWSVNMELYYYAALSLGVAATLSRAKRFMGFSLAFLAIFFVFMVLHDLRAINLSAARPYIHLYYFPLFYKSFLGVTFFFALGSLAYYRPKPELSLPMKIALLIVAVFIPLVGSGSTYGLILTLIAFGFCIGAIVWIWPDDRPTGFGRLLGDLSYPLFLIHWPVGAAVYWATGWPKNDVGFVLLATFASVTVAAALVLFLERPMEALRRKYRL